MRSRSRWNAVRSGSDSSSRSRPLDSKANAARSERTWRSICSVRSLTVRLESVTELQGSIRVRQDLLAFRCRDGGARLPPEDPISEVADGLPAVSIQSFPLALRSGVPRGGHIGLDAEVSGHPAAPQVVPRVGHQERAAESSVPPEDG